MIDPLHQYQIIRRDRISRVGGGVCALISKDFRILEYDFKEDEQTLMNHCESDILCFDILLPGARQRFILVYRPPSASIKKELLISKTQSFIKLISTLVDSHITTFILGDLNLPRINWATLSSVTDGVHNVVFNYLSSHGFSQFVTEPTRLKNSIGNNSDESTTGNILDIICSTDFLSINVDRMLAPISTSDHSQIEFSIFFPCYVNNTIIDCNPISDPHDYIESNDLPIFDWSNGNYDALCEMIQSYDWSLFFEYNLEAEKLWDNFKSVIWPMIHMFVPTKMVPHIKKYRIRQYPKAIRKLLSKKTAIWRLMKTKNNPELKLKYRKIAQECNLVIQKFDMDREKKILDSNNIGTFYKFINNKLSSKSGIAPLKSPDNRIICSDEEKAKLLNEYFESVFTVDNGSMPAFPSRISAGTPAKEDIKIQPEIIEKILHKLKINSSAGPDRLPPIFYKRTATSIAFPLGIMFRTFFELHIVPHEWGLSIITPIFKKVPRPILKIIAL